MASYVRYLPTMRFSGRHRAIFSFEAIFGKATKGIYVLFFGGPGSHVVAILRNATTPTMKKPRFTKCGFFVFLTFKSHCVLFWGALEAMLKSSSGMPRAQQ